MLRHIVDALTDAADSVRLDAARALEQLAGDGIEFLLSLIRESTDRDASAAGKALEIHRDSPDIQAACKMH